MKLVTLDSREPQAAQDRKDKLVTSVNKVLSDSKDTRVPPETLDRLEDLDLAAPLDLLDLLVQRVRQDTPVHQEVRVPLVPLEDRVPLATQEQADPPVHLVHPVLRATLAPVVRRVRPEHRDQKVSKVPVEAQDRQVSQEAWDHLALLELQDSLDHWDLREQRETLEHLATLEPLELRARLVSLVLLVVPVRLGTLVLREQQETRDSRDLLDSLVTLE